MLFSRHMIELVQQLRKPVMAELGESLLLADPALIDKLADIATRSRDPATRSTIADLLRLADEAGYARRDSERKSAEQSVRRVYRGCPIG